MQWVSKFFAGVLALATIGAAVWLLWARQSGPAPETATQVALERPLVMNLSLPRTGTVSIMAIFAPLGSAHEFMRAETIEQLYNWDEGAVSDKELDAFLLARAAALDEMLSQQLGAQHRLNVDSATFLYNVQDRLFTLFPDAKYLLCVRDGESWLVSFVGMLTFITESDHEVLKPREKYEKAMQKSFGPAFTLDIFADPEKLGERIAPVLPQLAEFWGKWTLETLQNLQRLPPERRLIIQTRDISDSLASLAALAGVPEAALDHERTHLNKDRQQHDFAALIGREKIRQAFAPWQAKVDAELKAALEP